MKVNVPIGCDENGATPGHYHPHTGQGHHLRPKRRALGFILLRGDQRFFSRKGQKLEHPACGRPTDLHLQAPPNKRLHLVHRRIVGGLLDVALHARGLGRRKLRGVASPVRLGGNTPRLPPLAEQLLDIGIAHAEEIRHGLLQRAHAITVPGAVVKIRGSPMGVREE